MGAMVYTARWCFSTNTVSMNKSEDPKSTRDESGILGMDSEVTRRMRVSGVVVTVAFRVAVVCAQIGLTQPSGGVGCGGCLVFFRLDLNDGCGGFCGSGPGFRCSWY